MKWFLKGQVWGTFQVNKLCYNDSLAWRIESIREKCNKNQGQNYVGSLEAMLRIFDYFENSRKPFKTFMREGWENPVGVMIIFAFCKIHNGYSLDSGLAATLRESSKSIAVVY